MLLEVLAFFSDILLLLLPEVLYNKMMNLLTCVGFLSALQAAASLHCCMWTLDNVYYIYMLYMFEHMHIQLYASNSAKLVRLLLLGGMSMCVWSVRFFVSEFLLFSPTCQVRVPRF